MLNGNLKKTAVLGIHKQNKYICRNSRSKQTKKNKLRRFVFKYFPNYFPSLFILSEKKNKGES